MSQWYSIYSFHMDAGGPPVDLTRFAFTPGVADTSRDNISWRIIDAAWPELFVYAEGPVTPDGALETPGGPLPDYWFPSNPDCPLDIEIQICFRPKPTDKCTKCPPPPSPTGSQSCPAETLSSQQGTVDLRTGRFQYNIPLLSVSAPGSGGWDFALNYFANSGLDGILGKNFGYPQSTYLVKLATFALTYNVELVDSNNARSIFEYVDGTVYSSDDNNTAATLIRNDADTADEEYVLTAANGTVTRFFGFDDEIVAPGQMKSLTDRFGNTSTFNWTVADGVPQLLSVTDAYGRTTQYRYYGAEKNHRLRELEDFLGRKLNFQYDEHDHLVAAVTPSIEQGAGGNTFPGGTAYVFQYDVLNPRPERRDDLIKIWYPNQATPYLDPATRTVDVQKVYADAVPRYIVEYGQEPSDLETWGRVTRETIGDPQGGVGGTYRYQYMAVPEDEDDNLIDSGKPLVERRIMFDRNDNQTIYDFIDTGMVARKEVVTNRRKIRLDGQPDEIRYVTWTKYNAQNQPTEIVMPEGNTIVREYESGTVSGISGTYVKRRGLLLRETHLPGNTLSLPARSGSSGQTELTRRFFYDPIFNQPCATIERRGNPVATSSSYFPPQNDGDTPTNADRSRYATITYLDYQQNQTATVTGNAALQALLGLDAGDIGDLITHVDNQMKATDGTGGIPAGFEMDLGDINGDGTGDGDSSGLDPAPILGSAVKRKHPDVRLIGSTGITTQVREEIFTHNALGQMTTHTDPEGNLTVYVRYPYSDPEGDGKFVAPGLGNKQYGFVREIHVDADPLDVMSLIGADGDLVDFIPGIIARTNTPGVYQKLVTRYEGDPAGTGGAGCSSCGAYDAQGNPLAVTDPRGFTTRHQRNEMGEVYRTIAPQPYLFQVETQYDANRNVVRVDTEDKQPAFASDDPTSACFAQFMPSGSGGTAHVPMKAVGQASGTGCSCAHDHADGEPHACACERPGWFTDRFTFDLLDNRIEEDRDATGSHPDRLITRYAYDFNQNLIQITKPEHCHGGIRGIEVRA